MTDGESGSDGECETAVINGPREGRWWQADFTASGVDAIGVQAARIQGYLYYEERCKCR